VIRVLNQREIGNIAELTDVFQEINWMGHGEVEIMRNQSMQKLNVSFK